MIQNNPSLHWELFETHKYKLKSYSLFETVVLSGVNGNCLISK